MKLVTIAYIVVIIVLYALYSFGIISGEQMGENIIIWLGVSYFTLHVITGFISFIKLDNQFKLKVVGRSLLTLFGLSLSALTPVGFVIYYFMLWPSFIITSFLKLNETTQGTEMFPTPTGLEYTITFILWFTFFLGIHTYFINRSTKKLTKVYGTSKI